MSEKITVTLTHYKRLDLLEDTISSFLRTNVYPIDQFLIIDDSEDLNISNEVIRQYSDVADIIVNESNIGQRKSIDKLIEKCRNDLIFHLEEDWLFDCSENTNYIAESIQILNLRKDIHQVHIRHQDDDPHCAVGDVCEVDGINFKMMDPDFRGEWNGFSFNPGLRRKSDITRMFPQGLQEFKDEKDAAMHTRKFNYKAVRLINTACRHIGWGRGVQGGGRGL
jgi:hypothetical protein